MVNGMSFVFKILENNQNVIHASHVNKLFLKFSVQKIIQISIYFVVHLF